MKVAGGSTQETMQTPMSMPTIMPMHVPRLMITQVHMPMTTQMTIVRIVIFYIMLAQILLMSIQVCKINWVLRDLNI